MNILYFTYALSGLAILTMAIGTGVLITRKFHLGWGIYWIGAATFIISQVGHIPFNYGMLLLIQRGFLPIPPAEWQLPVKAVALGLSAGLFEECARYLVLRWWAKDARSWATGLLFGAGHGGMEAIFIGVLILYIYIQLVAVQGIDLSTVVTQDRLALAQQQVSAYWSSTWYDSLLSAVERLFALPVQIGLAVMVMQAVTRGQIRWLGLAIAWHAAVDAVAVYAIPTWGIYITEGLVGVMSLVSLAIIFLLYKPEPVPTPEPVTVPLISGELLASISGLSETSENLDQTRFG